MGSKQLEFSVGFDAIKGARQYQQDMVQVWPEPAAGAVLGAGHLLAVLSDGMGGHVSGETASDLACRESVRYFTRTNGEPGARLEGALQAANSSIQREIQINSGLAGMGCTLIVAFVDQRGLRWASVGDSALYLYRSSRLFRLNEDHSLGALLDKQARAQVISREEARSSPHRRSLRSALTGAKIPIVDLEKEPNPLVAGDWVIMASDGLDTLAADTIATLIAQNMHRDPQTVVSRLLDEVRQRNIQNQDNTSIVAVKVEAREVGASHSPDNDGKTLRIDGGLMDGIEVAGMRRGELVGEAVETRSAVTEPLELRSKSRFKGIAAGLSFILAAIVMGAAVFAYVNGMPSRSNSSVTNERLPTPTDKK